MTLDSSYVTKKGKQIAAIKAMLDAVTAGGDPAPESVQGGPAANPIVNDIADTGADLVWTAVAGASCYRVSRAGADDRFQAVGETPRRPARSLARANERGLVRAAGLEPA